MELFNCYTKAEKELKEIELSTLSVQELIDLADSIKIDFDNQVLEDEIIVTSALHQIIKELGRRGCI